MAAYRYVEENGLATMLATKRLAGLTPEVNLREYVNTYTSRAAHSGFETQRRHHQKSKAGLSVASQKIKRKMICYMEVQYYYLQVPN